MASCCYGDENDDVNTITQTARRQHERAAEDVDMALAKYTALPRRKEQRKALEVSVVKVISQAHILFLSYCILTARAHPIHSQANRLQRGTRLRPWHEYYRYA